MTSNLSALLVCCVLGYFLVEAMHARENEREKAARYAAAIATCANGGAFKIGEQVVRCRRAK